VAIGSDTHAPATSRKRVMSIKYRLYGGFGILVVLAMGLVFYSVQEFNAAAVSIARINGTSGNMARAVLIED
jgi:CHASE3 domain sensor protein